MRKYTIEHVVYKFEELSKESQEKALDNMYDINTDHDWWEFIYEDANLVGLEITGFDLARRDITGKLIENMQQVCDNILRSHGNTCDTYVTAEKNKHRHGEDNEEQFEKDLLEDYLKILQEEYDYLTSEEAIIETIKANEYEFYEDGRLA